MEKLIIYSFILVVLNHVYGQYLYLGGLFSSPSKTIIMKLCCPSVDGDMLPADKIGSNIRATDCRCKSKPSIIVSTTKEEEKCFPPNTPWLEQAIKEKNLKIPKCVYYPNKIGAPKGFGYK
ncbi:CC-chemokine family protein [Fowlpox virus]|nr:CC-chemokine family protein [Fowlpox virus]AXY04820.1 CC-chemokine family protein [Fowlpox virus]